MGIKAVIITNTIELLVLALIIKLATMCIFVLLVPGSLIGLSVLKKIRTKKNLGSKVVGKQTMKGTVYSLTQDCAVKTDLPIPQYSKNQVLIKVSAASINPIDYKINLAKIPFVRWTAPMNIGRDVCGTIIAKGENVKGFEINDEVYGFVQAGSIQEYAVTNAPRIALKPKTIDTVNSAALPLVAITSVQALKDNGIKTGDRLLVVGASGGTGSQGVQLGKYYGCHVTGICSSRNAEMVKGLGADEIIPYDDPNFKELLDKQENFDFIYDTVTSPEDVNYELIVRKHLNKDKMYVAINATGSDWVRKFLSMNLHINLQRKGYDLTLLNMKCQKELNDLANAIDQGLVKPIIDTQYGIDDIKESFKKLGTRRTKGKLVFKI